MSTLEMILEPPTTAEETAVLEQVRRGDAAAFGTLVERYMRRAYRVAVALVGSPEDARDLSQDAFIRAFRARRRLDPERPFYPWYYQILRRLCLNFLRDRKSRREKLDAAAPWLVEDLGSRAERPDHDAERTELRRHLASALDELSEAQRETFVLREFDGLRYAEIAELLGVPIGTVMSRLYSARRQLARRLEAVREGGR